MTPHPAGGGPPSGAAAAPLAGLRILDLTRLLPGPYATLVLADLGADVVKIEDPEGGDYLRALPPLVGDSSALFHALNRNKRSVAIDLKRPAGREALLGLLRRFDVVVESFRPGVMERLGLGFEALKRRQPRTILCSITGYGQTGPLARRAGHDLNYQALGGLLSRPEHVREEAARPEHSNDGQAPQVPAAQLADVGGGSWPACVGLLAAAYERERTGVGRWIDISMAEGCLAFIALDLGRIGGGDPGPSLLGGAFACYGIYRTADGRHLALSTLEPKFWAPFCEAVGRPDWILRQWEVGAMRGEVEALFSTRTAAAWEEFLGPLDVCCERILYQDELPAHPAHVARGSFFEVEGLGATVRHARTPVRMGAPLEARPPPALGEHTWDVFEEAGFAAAELVRLREEGAIGCRTAI